MERGGALSRSIAAKTVGLAAAEYRIQATYRVTPDSFFVRNGWMSTLQHRAGGEHDFSIGALSSVWYGTAVSPVARVNLETEGASGVPRAKPVKRVGLARHTCEFGPPALCARVSSDGSMIVAITPQQLHVWTRIGNGRYVQRIVAPRLSGTHHSCLDLSEGLGVVAVGDENGYARLYSMREMAPLGAFRLGTMRVTGLEISDSTNELLAVLPGPYVHAYDLKRRKSAGKSRSGHVWGLSLTVTCDGQRMATGGYGGCARIWALPTRRLLRRTQSWNHALPCLATSSDGAVLACGGRGVKLADMETGRTICELATEEGDWILEVAFSKDGKLLAAAGTGGQVYLWRTGDWKLLRELKGHRSVVRSLAFFAGGKKLLTASEDSTLKIWEVATGTLVRSLPLRTSEN
jgi:WD40 repeat protein